MLLRVQWGDLTKALHENGGVYGALSARRPLLPRSGSPFRSFASAHFKTFLQELRGNVLLASRRYSYFGVVG